MAIQKILLPYNFTNFDLKAIDFVSLAFAHFEQAQVAVFHAYTPVPEIEVQATSVMGKLKTNMNYLAQKISEKEAELGVVKARLVEKGFAPGNVRTVFKARKKDIAGEIIDLAAAEHFDVVVINHKPGRATRFFTGSIFNKVVSALKDTTVCIVS